MLTPDISIITTCKGRLQELTQSISSMYDQKSSELIVVDYNCPDKTRDYVRAKFPDAVIVCEDDASYFHQSRARNLGAKRAKGRILAFVDADVVLRPDFCSTIQSSFRTGSFGLFKFIEGKFDGIYGSCVVEKKSWEAVCGYDEVMVGYGQEDFDFYSRLRLLGLEEFGLDTEALVSDVIKTPTDKKSTHYIDKDPDRTTAINSAYRMIKRQILINQSKVELDLSSRKGIYDNIKQNYDSSVLRPGDSTFFSVTLGQKPRKNHYLDLVIGVKITLASREFSWPPQHTRDE
jgi:hypothetical protein